MVSEIILPSPLIFQTADTPRPEEGMSPAWCHTLVGDRAGTRASSPERKALLFPIHFAIYPVVEPRGSELLVWFSSSKDILFLLPSFSKQLARPGNMTWPHMGTAWPTEKLG